MCIRLTVIYFYVYFMLVIVASVACCAVGRYHALDMARIISGVEGSFRLLNLLLIFFSFFSRFPCSQSQHGGRDGRANALMLHTHITIVIYYYS